MNHSLRGCARGRIKFLIVNTKNYYLYHVRFRANLYHLLFQAILHDTCRARAKIIKGLSGIFVS